MLWWCSGGKWRVWSQGHSDKIKEQNWLQEAPDEDTKPSNYHEEQTNSIYQKFKEKLHNAQALNNNKD